MESVDHSSFDESDGSETDGESQSSSSSGDIVYPYQCPCGVVVNGYKVHLEHIKGSRHQKYLGGSEQQTEDDPSGAGSPDKRSPDYTCTEVVRDVPFGDRLGVQLCTQYRISFTVGQRPVALANPHSAAETLRWAMRSKEAFLVTKALNRLDGSGLRYGAVVLFPSPGELSAFNNLIKGPTPVWGFRRVLSDDDRARGREVYPTSLTQARVLIANDCIYYFSPTDLVQMLLADRNTYLTSINSGGVCMFLGARHFSTHGKCLFIDRYKQEEQLAQTYTVHEMIRKPLLTAEGAPILRPVKRGKFGKVVMIPTFSEEVVQVERNIPALNAYDVIEGRGRSKNGVLTFYSSYSAETGGDAVYIHTLKGQEFLECSTIGVTIDEQHFVLSNHVEWKIGTYLLIRCVIKRVEVPVVTVRTGRASPSFVLNNVIPSICSELRSRATSVDPSDKGSLTSFFEWAEKKMVLNLGQRNYAGLLIYHKMLERAARNTAELALADRPSWTNMPGNGTIADMAAQHRAAGVMQKLNVPQGVADSYVRLTEKSTRAQFWVNVLASCSDALRWIWEQFCRFGRFAKSLFKVVEVPSGFNLLQVAISSAMKINPFLRKAMRSIHKYVTNVGVVSRAVLALQAKAVAYPKTMRVMDEIFFAIECLVTAFCEESIKRWSPAGIALLFGSIEAIVEGLPDLIDSGLGTTTISRLFLAMVVRGVSHLILRLIPFPIAVVVHALCNWIYERPTRKAWSVLLDEWALNLMEREIDDISMSSPDDIILRSDLYVKSPHGEEIPLADAPVAATLLSTEVRSSKYIMVNCDVARMDILSVPSCTLADTVNMYVVRMMKTLPYEGDNKFWFTAAREFLTVFGEARLTINGRFFQPMSFDELCEYIDARPAYTLARKELLKSHVRAYEVRSRQTKKVKIGGKPKEVLQNQPAMSAAGFATKTRPICPITAHGVVEMAIAVPFKNWISGLTHFIYKSGHFWHVPFPVRDEFNVAICYSASPTPSFLDHAHGVLRAYHGLGLLGHGDDGYVMYVDEYLEVAAAATDAVSCDLTCGPPHQKHYAEFVDWASESKGTQIIAEQLAALSGEQMLEIRGVLENIFFKKPRPSTNTGQATTSTKAFFPQGVAFLQIVHECFEGGKFRPCRYKAALEKVWKKLGLIPEWEVAKSTPEEVWYPADEVSFVGGYFFRSIAGDYNWQSISTLKKYIVGPDVLSVYVGLLSGMDDSTAQLRTAALCHMSVLVTDPDLNCNPVHRSLRAWMERVLEAAHFGMNRQAAMTYDAYVRQTDGWKWEMRQGAEPAEVVDDAVYFDTVDRICERHDVPHAGATMRALCAELDATPGSEWRPELQTSLLPLFTLRFGAAKNQSKISGLNFLNIVFVSGKKIFSTFFMKKAKVAKEVKKEVKREVKKEDGKRREPEKRAAEPKVARPVQQAAQAKQAGPPPVRVSPSAVGVLACANGYCNANATSEPSPDLLGVGTGTGDKKCFVAKNTSLVVANAQGFAYWAAEATGWVPNPDTEDSQPATSYIGGPGLGTGPGNGTVRGPMIHWSNNAYAGTAAVAVPVAPTSTAQQVPATGTKLMDLDGTPNAPAGIEFETLPIFFISNQEAVDESSIDASEDRPTYTLSHLTARIEPDGYVTGTAEAVNVVSGDIQGVSYTAGDDRKWNSFSPLAVSSTAAQDSSDWVDSLPAHTLKSLDASVSEWKKGDAMHLVAVPNTSCAMGAWPATVLDPHAPSGEGSLVATAVDSPQIYFIITGAQPNQKFKVHWRANLTAFGNMTYDESAQSTSMRKPVDPTQLSDVLTRVMPKKAVPLIAPVGASNPTGVHAFAQHVSDTGVATGAGILPYVKTAAKVADVAGSTGIGEILGDIGMGLLAAIF